MQLKGRLVPQSHSANTDLSAYQVAVYYAAQVLDGSQIIERRFDVASDGAFTVRLSGNARSDNAARIAALSPAGQVLVSHAIRHLQPQNGVLGDIRIPDPDPAFKISDIAISAMRSMRLNGRVLVSAGSASALSLELHGDDGTGARVLWSGVTDRNGYFNGTIKNLKLQAAELRVTGNQPRTEPIVLQPDGTLPNPLLVVLDDRINPDHCACDDPTPALPEADELAAQGESYSQDLGTGCQTMTTPNRTLEEFDFFQIVRTTDPSIRGVRSGTKTPGKPARAGMDKLVFDIGTLAQETGASTYAARTEYKRSTSAEMTDPAPIPISDNERAIVELGRVTRSLTDAGAISAADFQEDLKAHISVDSLSAEGVGISALWRAASAEASALSAMNSALDKIPAAALNMAITDPDGFTPDKLMTLERQSSAEALRIYLDGRSKTQPARAAMSEDNPVDWDHTPDFYQATSVAHGHILQFKQEWKADGYSLGDLVQSIPLAPGQQKQIVTLDWDREDRTARTESTSSSEFIQADLARDRDINEIANSAFRENISGSSSSRTGAVGGGFGLAIGPLVIGGGGGSGWSSSTARNDASREFTANSLNQLRDTTSQAASAVRNQRSTVVRSTSQVESVGAVTERIANFNRCHALTIQYFEVLRHFAVQERLVRVSECLFVPLEMTRFDDAKVLRWREILERYMMNRRYRRGFEAIEKLSSPATTPPNRRFADDPIEEMSGRLRLRVSIARPKDPTEETRAALEQTEWRFFAWTLRVSPETLYEQYSRNSAKKDEIFRTEIAPKVAREFLNELEVFLIDRDGDEHKADFDLTVTSRYVENGIMEVVLNDNAVTDRIPRAEIAGVEVRSKYALPEFSRVILEDARITYRTARMRHRLVSRRGIHDDVMVDDPAFVATSDMSWIEERNQLAEDRKRRRRLLRHLNDNTEYYHRAIWLGMDANRRYMLLDGFEAPNAGGRSIASVVENRLIGIVGNCMVMPVAPGFQLDPVLRDALEEEQTDDPDGVLTRIYKMPPSPPRRHSVPTRGVFGEAMSGTCVSCEEIEEDRFWRWSDYPLPDSPPAIAALSTDSRYAAPGGLSPTAFPDALIKYQDIPDAPNPTGMTAALEILGKDVFKDLTGLTMNQKNALAALTASMDSAQAFAGEAVSLAMAKDSAAKLDRTLGQIESAKSAGYLSNDQASAAARDAMLRSFGGSNAPAAKPVTESAPVADAIKQAANSPDGSATITRQNGDTVETVSFETDASELGIGFKPVTEWLEVELMAEQMPLHVDGFKSGGKDYETKAFEKMADVRAKSVFEVPFPLDAANDFAVPDDLFNFPTAVTRRIINTFDAAEAAGLVRKNAADPDKFDVLIETRLGYPAKSSSKTSPRAVHFPHSGKRKMPLVVIVHGNAPAWLPTGKATSIGFPNVSGKVKSLPNHEGYKYLQEHFAAQDAPFITLSVNTNIANASDSLIAMRAEIVNRAVKLLKDKVNDPKSDLAFLKEAIDFDNVGLIGHSRGGEAVVGAVSSASAAGVYKPRAILSLSATDFAGVPDKSALKLDDKSIAFLGVWGGMDNDVSGERLAARRNVGSVLRFYDRVESPKAFVFVPSCSHNSFNNPVWKVEKEWSKDVAGVRVPDLPTGLASEAEHEEVLKEISYAFFDLILNNNATQQAVFRNESHLATGINVVQQWDFAPGKLDVDTFEAAAAQFGTRAPGPNFNRLRVTPAIAPATTATGNRDAHTNHDTQVALLDLTALPAGGSGKITYDLTVNVAGDGVNLSTFNDLTFRLGQLYNVSSQVKLDAQDLPDFVVRLVDRRTGAFEIKSADIYAATKNKVAPPILKLVNGGANNVTQTAMHSLSVPLNGVSKDAGDHTALLDATDVIALEFEFFVKSTQTEVWIDSIRFIRK